MWKISSRNVCGLFTSATRCSKSSSPTDPTDLRRRSFSGASSPSIRLALEAGDSCDPDKCDGSRKDSLINFVLVCRVSLSCGGGCFSAANRTGTKGAGEDFSVKPGVRRGLAGVSGSSTSSSPS